MADASALSAVLRCWEAEHPGVCWRAVERAVDEEMAVRVERWLAGKEAGRRCWTEAQREERLSGRA